MAHSNTITNENLSDSEEPIKEEEIKKTNKPPKKPSSLLKKRIDERAIGTSLDAKLFGVKVEAGRDLIKNDDGRDLSDSDDDTPPCLARSHKASLELNTEYLDIRADSDSVEVEVDTDIIDVVMNVDKPKKKSSKDSTSSMPKQKQKLGRPKKTDADYAEEARLEQLKEAKTERARQRACDARNARALLASKRFENKARIFMEQEQIKTQELERVENTYKENEALKLRLIELEARILQTTKPTDQIPMKAQPMPQPAQPSAQRVERSKNYQFF